MANQIEQTNEKRVLQMLGKIQENVSKRRWSKMLTGNLSKHTRGEKRGYHDYENELKMSNED